MALRHQTLRYWTNTQGEDDGTGEEEEDEDDGCVMYLVSIICGCPTHRDRLDHSLATADKDPSLPLKDLFFFTAPIQQHSIIQLPLSLTIRLNFLSSENPILKAPYIYRLVGFQKAGKICFGDPSGRLFIIQKKNWS